MDVTEWVRQSRKNQQTGTVIEIWDADHPDAWLMNDGRWVTICVDHGANVNHLTIADARGHAADPALWCDQCRETAGARDRGYQARVAGAARLAPVLDYTDPDKQLGMNQTAVRRWYAGWDAANTVRPDRTELGIGDPELAAQLLDDGWLPVEARLLQPLHRIVFWDTDVFQLDTVGTHKTATVQRVDDPGHGTIIVHHGLGTTEADECEEVWTHA